MRLLSSVGWLVGTAAVTAAAYVLVLGWNAKMSVAPEEPGAVGTECVGPYESWQVVVLAVVLAAVVVAGAWAGHYLVVPTAVATTSMVLFAVDAITVDDPCRDNSLLALGVLLVFAASTGGAAVIVALTLALKSRGSPSARPPAQP